MAYEFPSNPSNGDTDVVNGIRYVYNSTDNTWTPEEGAGGGAGQTLAAGEGIIINDDNEIEVDSTVVSLRFRRLTNDSDFTTLKSAYDGNTATTGTFSLKPRTAQEENDLQTYIQVLIPVVDENGDRFRSDGFDTNQIFHIIDTQTDSEWYVRKLTTQGEDSKRTGDIDQQYDIFRARVQTTPDGTSEAANLTNGVPANIDGRVFNSPDPILDTAGVGINETQFYEENTVAVDTEVIADTEWVKDYVENNAGGGSDYIVENLAGTVPTLGSATDSIHIGEASSWGSSVSNTKVFGNGGSIAHSNAMVLGDNITTAQDSELAISYPQVRFQDENFHTTAGDGQFLTTNDAGVLTLATPSVEANTSFSDGTAASPSIAFTDDSNTGIYRVGNDQIGISTGGTQRMRMSTTTTFETPILVQDGSASFPGVRFESDGNTGIYRSGTDTLSITVGGDGKFDFSSSGLTIDSTTVDDTNLAQLNRFGVNTPGDNTYPKYDAGLLAGFEYVADTLGQRNDVSSTAATDGQVLTWNNDDSQWEPQDAAGGSSVTYSTTPPSSPSNGDQWFNSDSDDLNTYIYNSTLDAWIDSSPGASALSDGSIDTAQLADDAVTPAKLGSTSSEIIGILKLEAESNGDPIVGDFDGNVTLIGQY